MEQDVARPRRGRSQMAHVGFFFVPQAAAGLFEPEKALSIDRWICLMVSESKFVRTDSCNQMRKGACEPLGVIKVDPFIWTMNVSAWPNKTKSKNLSLRV